MGSLQSSWEDRIMKEYLFHIAQSIYLYAPSWGISSNLRIKKNGLLIPCSASIRYLQFDSKEHCQNLNTMMDLALKRKGPGPHTRESLLVLCLEVNQDTMGITFKVNPYHPTMKRVMERVLLPLSVRTLILLCRVLPSDLVKMVKQYRAIQSWPYRPRTYIT